MDFERVDYMCPKCNEIHFFNKAEKFSTICPECNVEMLYIGNKFTSTEEMQRRRQRWEKKLQQSVNVVCCPYCNSVDTSKISTTSKVVNTVIFGVFGTKRYKQWHCNKCGSDF